MVKRRSEVTRCMTFELMQEGSLWTTVRMDTGTWINNQNEKQEFSEFILPLIAGPSVVISESDLTFSKCVH